MSTLAWRYMCVCVCVAVAHCGLVLTENLIECEDVDENLRPSTVDDV